MKIKLRNNSGITLVALIVTIIVLVILSTISISLVLNQKGIFAQANQAKELSKIEEYRERIDLILTEEVLKSNIENRPIIITGLIERFKIESFIGSAERIDVEEVETKGTIRLITTDGYIYEVILEGEKLYSVSQGKDDGEPYPTITLEQLPMQGIENEKIQIKVTGEVAKGKETTGIAYVERIDNKEKRDYQEGGIIFEIEENGTYLFSVTTNKGKSRIGKIIINVEQPKDIIAITANPITATNKEVEVTIRYGKTEFNNADRYQYKIGTEGNWQTATKNTITIKISKNTVIVAKYYDGKNSFKVENYNIQNIDKIAPNDFTIAVSEITQTTLTITGSNTTDIGSIGCDSSNIGIVKYEYFINEENKGTTNIITNLDANTSYSVYVKATDKAGNSKDSNTINVTTKELVKKEEFLKGYDYTGNVQTLEVKKGEIYKFELWAASGGGGWSSPGYGSYASGYYTPTTDETLYLYIGGEGQIRTGGFNGGGIGGNDDYGAVELGYGGGGATDIRKISGAWNNSAGLNSRIAVAGAGGGARWMGQ